jgi:hypothetical protein
LFTREFPRENIALIIRDTTSARIDNVKSTEERQAKHRLFFARRARAMHAT